MQLLLKQISLMLMTSNLVVTDGGNGYAADWANWINPTLVGPKGEMKLTDVKWKSAKAGWGNVNVNKNAQGDKLVVDGKVHENGIGTHSNSIIHFQLPKGYTKFTAMGGLDKGGSSQGGTSVVFAVYTEKPANHQASGNVTQAGIHEPENAVSFLDHPKDLEVTLVASEPTMLSPTNLDVDAKGRIWLCEVQNYRHRNGSRKEGDRILILEDTDHDGVADNTKVFYQGHDVDTAMGICVLGNKVIVSATPNIVVFTDENGDDIPDKKEYLFTKSGRVQHDHSLHTFLFGPDGKLYWNFGNTGVSVHDQNGKQVIDETGNPVLDNGKPYFGGMVFRCNEDGSQFEVLGHNFRNNYEVTVDSYGTLWQSDNDDDGNRAVRINYVMEYGNYGYKNELNGAGWRSPRTGHACRNSLSAFSSK